MNKNERGRARMALLGLAACLSAAYGLAVMSGSEVSAAASSAATVVETPGREDCRSRGPYNTTIGYVACGSGGAADRTQDDVIVIYHR